MTLGSLNSEPHRVRLGLLVLLIGVLLFLWAWGNWIFRASRASDQPVATSPSEHEPPPQTVKAARSMSAVLLLGLLLVIVFLAASYAIVRSSRRLRELIFRERPPPTTSDDVWAMHKLPPEE